MNTSTKLETPGFRFRELERRAIPVRFSAGRRKTRLSGGFYRREVEGGLVSWEICGGGRELVSFGWKIRGGKRNDAPFRFNLLKRTGLTRHSSSFFRRAVENGNLRCYFSRSSRTARFRLLIGAVHFNFSKRTGTTRHSSSFRPVTPIYSETKAPACR